MRVRLLCSSENEPYLFFQPPVPHSGREFTGPCRMLSISCQVADGNATAPPPNASRKFFSARPDARMIRRRDSLADSSAPKSCQSDRNDVRLVGILFT